MKSKFNPSPLPLLTLLVMLLTGQSAFGQIVGIGIDKRDNKLVIWYDNGTVASGASYLLNSYQPSSSEYILPEGKSANDIVGMSISSANRVYAWYADGTRSAGKNYKDLVSNRSVERFNLPPGKSTSDIVGMAIDATDKVYAWYSDYTVSVGNSKDLNSLLETTHFQLPAGISPGNIIEMEFANNNQLYTWLIDGTVLVGTYQNLGYTSHSPRQENANMVSDPTGHQYGTIRLANLTWTKENMNYESQAGSWCYDNNPDYCQNYGLLYTWRAAIQACNTLGDGWRLPSRAEWDQLYRLWGNRSYSALTVGGRSNFSVLLGGYRDQDGWFFTLGTVGAFWTSTPVDELSALSYNFHSNTRKMLIGQDEKNRSFSCRCVHD